MLRNAKKNRITWESFSASPARAPNNSSHKAFFSFKLTQCIFSTIFKCHVVSQKQSEDFINEITFWHD